MQQRSAAYKTCQGSPCLLTDKELQHTSGLPSLTINKELQQQAADLIYRILMVIIAITFQPGLGACWRMSYLQSHQDLKAECVDRAADVEV